MSQVSEHDARSAAYPHATVCSGCHACQPERFPNTSATATVMLDARPPLDSVGIVCVCGKWDETFLCPTCKASAAQGRKSSEEAWGTDANGVVGEGWPDGSGVLAGASGNREAGPAGNDGRASDPSAATGHRYDLRPMTTPDPGREPAPEDFETGSEYHAAYEAWLARWQPWMREREERGYV